jgi:nucleoside-diphosphate-sugar epimerase
MPSQTIQKVMVVGGTGRSGKPIIKALVEAGFEVSALSRASSKSTGPDNIKIVKTEYTHNQLVEAMKGQDAIVACVDTFAVDQQRPLIDAAVEAGVKRFLPSEFGVDTASKGLSDKVPATKFKLETVQYLKTLEAKGMSWTATIVGGFFGPGFTVPYVCKSSAPDRNVPIRIRGRRPV